MSASETDEADDEHGSTLEAWVRLASIPGISSTSQRKLLTAFREPAAALRASMTDVVGVLGQRAGHAWRNGPDPGLVNRALEWLRAPGNRLITLADAIYPPALLNTPDPPPVLYAKGHFELLARRGIAIVGARSATP